MGLKVMAAEFKTVGRTVSAVGKQIEEKAGTHFSSFYLVRGPSPWDGATHVWGGPDSVKPLWKCPHRHT